MYEGCGVNVGFGYSQKVINEHSVTERKELKGTHDTWQEGPHPSISSP